jgi:hypothetical protein
MGSGVFKVGDLVIGFAKPPRHHDDHIWDGRIGTIEEIYNYSKPSDDHVLVRYSSASMDYWYYDMSEIINAKPHIINTILNEI